MATIRDKVADAYAAGSSFSIPIPGGAVAGDRAFLMVRRNFGINIASGWDAVWSPLEGGFAFMLLMTRVLDSSDIAAGQVNFVVTGSGAMGYIFVVFEGDVSWRDPFAASLVGKGNNSDSDLDADADTKAGDLCLLFGLNTNWSDQTFTLPSGATQELFHPDSDGVSTCLYSYVPSSDGAFTARHHNQWSGTVYQAILAFGAAGLYRRRQQTVIC